MKKVNAIPCSGTALALLLGACSLAPPLKTPAIPTADAYKEIGSWTRAEPADRLPRDSWWTLYDSAELDGLEKRLIAGNPTLAAALANYAQARALADQARAGLFPTLALSGGVSRNRESINTPLRGPTTPTYYNDNVVGGGVSYELDLWGQIRNEVAAATLTEIFYEMDRMRSLPVTPQELESARSYLTGVFSLGVATQDGVLGQLSTVYLDRLPENYLETYREKIHELTADDILTAARIGIAAFMLAVSLFAAHLILPAHRPRVQDLLPGVALTFVASAAFLAVTSASISPASDLPALAFASCASVCPERNSPRSCAALTPR